MHVPTTFIADLFSLVRERGGFVCISAEVNLMLISAGLGMTIPGKEFDDQKRCDQPQRLGMRYYVWLAFLPLRHIPPSLFLFFFFTNQLIHIELCSHWSIMSLTCYLPTCLQT